MCLNIFVSMPYIKIENTINFHQVKLHDGNEKREPTLKIVRLYNQTSNVCVIFRHSYFVDDLVLKTKFNVNFEIWRCEEIYIGSITVNEMFDLQIEDMVLKEDETNSFLRSKTILAQCPIEYLHNESGCIIWKICNIKTIGERQNKSFNLKYYLKYNEENVTKEVMQVRNISSQTSDQIDIMKELMLQFFKAPLSDPDLTIICEDEKSVKFHKSHLSRCSETFKVMLEYPNTIESKSSEINLSNVTYSTLKTFRKILYGKVEDLKIEDLTPDLMLFADQYQIEFLYNYIRKQNTLVTQDSVKELYLLAKSKEDKQLEEVVFDFVKKNLGKLELDEDWDEFLSAHPEFSIKLVKNITFSKK